MSHPTRGGSWVHLVTEGPGGLRCTAALVTSMAGETDAYRDHTYIGCRAWTDLDEINRPLLLGGSRHDGGRFVDGGAAWACDGKDHDPDTWHPPAAARHEDT